MQPTRGTLARNGDTATLPAHLWGVGRVGRVDHGLVAGAAGCRYPHGPVRIVRTGAAGVQLSPPVPHRSAAPCCQRGDWWAGAGFALHRRGPGAGHLAQATFRAAIGRLRAAMWALPCQPVVLVAMCAQRLPNAPAKGHTAVYTKGESIRSNMTWTYRHVAGCVANALLAFSKPLASEHGAQP